MFSLLNAQQLLRAAYPQESINIQCECWFWDHAPQSGWQTSFRVYVTQDHGQAGHHFTGKTLEEAVRGALDAAKVKHTVLIAGAPHPEAPPLEPVLDTSEMEERQYKDWQAGLRPDLDAEAQRVADPTYTPTLEEALRHPEEFVAGMIEEPPVVHQGIPNYKPLPK